jgi:hypothetical protein
MSALHDPSEPSNGYGRLWMPPPYESPNHSGSIRVNHIFLTNYVGT